MSVIEITTTKQNETDLQTLMHAVWATQAKGAETPEDVREVLQTETGFTIERIRELFKLVIHGAETEGSE